MYNIFSKTERTGKPGSLHYSDYLFFSVSSVLKGNAYTLAFHAVISNKSFGAWAERMSDEAVATAMLDRLLHHAHILSMKGNSYRM